MVSLAFHVFVVGSYFCLCALMSSQVNFFFIPSKENVGATHKEQRQCTYVKD